VLISDESDDQHSCIVDIAIDFDSIRSHFSSFAVNAKVKQLFNKALTSFFYGIRIAFFH